MTDYALDRYSPAQHVVAELERAWPQALSLSSLAAGYRHPNPGDLSRVRQHQRVASPELWLIAQAVRDLKDYLAIDADKPDVFLTFKQGVRARHVHLDGRRVHLPRQSQETLPEPSTTFLPGVRVMMSREHPEAHALAARALALGVEPSSVQIARETGVPRVKVREIIAYERGRLDPVPAPEMSEDGHAHRWACSVCGEGRHS